MKTSTVRIKHILKTNTSESHSCLCFGFFNYNLVN